MASIKQAAQWMSEGKSVRRRAWRVTCKRISQKNIQIGFYGRYVRGTYYKSRRRHDISLCTEDILANDWMVEGLAKNDRAERIKPERRGRWQKLR